MLRRDGQPKDLKDYMFERSGRRPGHFSSAFLIKAYLRLFITLMFLSSVGKQKIVLHLAQ